MTNKMTKKDCFIALLAISAVSEKPELVEFINHELEQLAKKSSSGIRKPTENQMENENIKLKILDILEDGKERTISEIQSADDSLTGLSNQKMNAIILQLKKMGRVERVEIKRKAYFKRIC